MRPHGLPLGSQVDRVGIPDKKGDPSSSSIFLIWADMAGWEIPMVSAALERFSRLATHKKHFMLKVSIFPPPIFSYHLL